MLGGAFAGGGTVAVVAVDGDRNGVAMLQSNAAGWGAHLVVPGVGIFLHNRGVGFNLEPGHPAEYGPGRRPPHTLAPAVVTRSDGSLHTVAATMGGDSQPQVLLQLLARTLQVGQAPGSAMAAGRWALSTRVTAEDDELATIGFQTWRAASTAWRPGATTSSRRRSSTTASVTPSSSPSPAITSRALPTPGPGAGRRRRGELPAPPGGLGGARAGGAGGRLPGPGLLKRRPHRGRTGRGAASPGHPRRRTGRAPR